MSDTNNQDEAPATNNEEKDIVTSGTVSSAPATENIEITKNNDVPPEPAKRFPNVITQNSVQAFETSEPLPKDMESDDPLHVPSAPIDRLTEISKEIDELVNTGAIGSAEDAWAEVIDNSYELLPLLKAYAKTVENPEAKFEQAVSSPTGLLRAGKGSQRAMSNVALTGEKALNYVRGHMKMGTTMKVPLWHSGFWITISAPSEVDLLELNRKIAQAKIKLGRYTSGAVFSNTRCYSTDALVDFVLSNTIATSVKVPDGENIKSMILVHDIPALIWGIACTVWPNGFKYKTACTAEPATCHHVVEEKLNLDKLYHCDTQSLTASQIAHMSNNSKDVMTFDSVKTYQDQFLKNQGREVTIYPGEDRQIKFLLKTPSALEYIQHGSRWIESAANTVISALGMEAKDDTRENYIRNVAQADVMRNYSHWVKKIVIGDDNVTIEDVDTIEATLGTLSSVDDLRGKFDKAVTSYIDDSVMSLIGVYSYDCPMCGGEQKPPRALPRLANIIPIDANQLFFIRLVQKIASMSLR